MYFCPVLVQMGSPSLNEDTRCVSHTAGSRKGTEFATELDEPAQYLALLSWSPAWLLTLVKIHKDADHRALQRE